MEEALRAHLLAQVAITALVGTRIDWNVRPQGKALPAIVLHFVSGGGDYTMQRRTGFNDTVVQIDVWSATYLAALTISRLIKTALDDLRLPPLQAFLESERHDFEANPAPAPTTGATDFHRVSLDVRIVHTDA